MTIILSPPVFNPKVLASSSSRDNTFNLHLNTNKGIIPSNMGIAIVFMSLGEILAKLPINQKVIVGSLSFVSAKYFIKKVRAVNIEPTNTPVITRDIMIFLDPSTYQIY